MAPKKKKHLFTLNDSIELIKKNKQTFIVGSSALLLGIAVGMIIMQQSLAPTSPGIKNNPMQTTQDQKSMEYLPYTMQENESLWDVADRFYGDPYQYTRIAQDNNLENPDAIAPGTVIKLYHLPK